MSRSNDRDEDLGIFPGGDLVATGLSDLARGIVSEEALVLMVAAPRLRGLGIEVQELPGISRPYEHALYERIEARMPRGAHSAYNALIQRIVSFANSYRISDSETSASN
jgi:hypothetical protein